MKRLLMVVLIVLALLSLSAPTRMLQAATFAYIPSHDNNKVIRVNTGDGTFASLDLAGGPYGAAVMPDGSFVMVTRTGDDAVAAISNAHFEGIGTPTMIIVGDEPRGVAIEPGGEFAYVANFSDDTVSVIDTATRLVTATIPIGDGAGGPLADGPWGIVAVREPDTDAIKVYVSNHLTGTVSVITDNSATIGTISGVGIQPLGLAAGPDGRFVYVANFTQGLTGNVRVIRTSDDTLLPTAITVGRGPWGVAVGSRGDFVYVSNSAPLSNSVSVIRTIDNSVITPASLVGNRPHGVAAPKNGDFAYVINQAAATISEIDISTGIPSVTSIPPDSAHPLLNAFALGSFIGGAPPAAPSGLSGAASAFDRIALSWTDNSTDELGFQIERRVQGDAAFIELVQIAADATSYTDGTVAGRRTYEYRIRAFNETGESGYATSSAIATPEGDFTWCFIGTLLR